MVDIIKGRTGVEDDGHFFRVQSILFLTNVAATMRAKVELVPGEQIVINMFALVLAKSGYGKGYSESILKSMVGGFSRKFNTQTLELAETTRMSELANMASVNKGTPFTDEMELLQEQAAVLGYVPFTFSRTTAAAVSQARSKRALSGIGAVTYICDEVVSNMGNVMAVLGVFLAIYNGGEDEVMLKNSTDNKRVITQEDVVPAVLLLTGTPAKILRGGIEEKHLMGAIEEGLGRRVIMAFPESVNKVTKKTAKQRYQELLTSAQVSSMKAVQDKLEYLADVVNHNAVIYVEQDEGILVMEYKMWCEDRADKIPEIQAKLEIEMRNREHKMLKIAGTIAFIEHSPIMKREHLIWAIKLVEESGIHYARFVSTKKPFVRLAEWLSKQLEPVNEAQMVEELPYFSGSAPVKKEIIALAMAYGVKNNISVETVDISGITHYKAQSLDKVNMGKLRVSYTPKLGDPYKNTTIAFSKLDKLTQNASFRWCSHFMMDHHRSEDTTVQGFDLIVVEVDGTATMDEAALLLEDYGFYMYATKSATSKLERFRMVFPMSHHLVLDAEAYKDFMDSFCQWLPIVVDPNTHQRSRQWASFPNTSRFIDGKAINVFEHMTATRTVPQYVNDLTDPASLDRLEAYFVNQATSGNRNNVLAAYAFKLVELGGSEKVITDKVEILNKKLKKPLKGKELKDTVLTTVRNRIKKRGN